MSYVKHFVVVYSLLTFTLFLLVVLHCSVNHSAGRADFAHPFLRVHRQGTVRSSITQSINCTHTITKLATHCAQTLITHTNPDNSNSPHTCYPGLLSVILKFSSFPNICSVTHEETVI